MPPDDRPIPRFIAEPPQEALPYGRWADALAERFLAECRRIDSDEDLGEPFAEEGIDHVAMEKALA